MKRYVALLPILSMFFLILDSRTAAEAAAEGVCMVLQTALPALFPFFVLSAMVVPFCTTIHIPVLAQILAVPSGWESVFLLGCIGGYPVGAQCIVQGCSAGLLRNEDAENMLALCSNCGPSFLFGVVAASFSDLSDPIGIFAIGILSSVLTRHLYAKPISSDAGQPHMDSVPLTQAVQMGLRSMASVGAWIILGKVILTILNKYILHSLPTPVRLILNGMVELTNGCLTLAAFPEKWRFIAACCFTSFGGLCVWMQVRALCAKEGLRAKYYLPQKLTQCIIAAILALAYVHTPENILLRLSILLVLSGICLFFKKTVEIFPAMLYNHSN